MIQIDIVIGEHHDDHRANITTLRKSTVCTEAAATAVGEIERKCQAEGSTMQTVRHLVFQLFIHSVVK